MDNSRVCGNGSRFLQRCRCCRVIIVRPRHNQYWTEKTSERSMRTILTDVYWRTCIHAVRPLASWNRVVMLVRRGQPAVTTDTDYRLPLLLLFSPTTTNTIIIHTHTTRRFICVHVCVRAFHSCSGANEFVQDMNKARWWPDHQQFSSRTVRPLPFK